MSGDKLQEKIAQLGLDDKDGSSSSSPTKHATRIDLASLRTNTMFEQRDAINQNQDKPINEWTVPPQRNGRTPRAATLFLGKDHERWQQYERERMDGPGGAGLRIAWRAGTSSTIQIGSHSNFESDDDEEYEEDRYSTYTSDTETDDHLSVGDGASTEAASSKGASSRRSSIRRSSSKSHGKAFPRIVQADHTRRGSAADSGSSSYSGGEFGSTDSPHFPNRPRRFSSNGPEAAFLRHETVIGIHTPRRDSSSSNTSSARVALAPLSQIKTPPSGRRSSISVSPHKNEKKEKSKGRGSPGKHQPIKHVRSTEMLEKAALAAASAISKERQGDRSISKEFLDEWDAVKKQDAETRYDPDRQYQASSSTALKLAPRRKPVRVEGTLYDRSGPFREGAVTDGLCVRFFSSEDASQTAAYESNASTSNDVAVADEEMVPTTYLITTPDNRVSSAAKLRRWAMDGEGKFYAAMEIKSIEAKMRAADPSTAGNGIPKSVLRGLRERYVDDLLDEVQKAETLNPDRTAVSHVLCTSDNKYLRLEEDYPEEAFFVIAGCEENELKPVVSLVFVNALRAITGFHSAGWLHGDIKLENLMFDESGKLVVIDYENANPFRGIPGGDGKVTLASYDWIPPEAFLGPQGRRAGPSADLWALGCNIVRAFALRDNVEDVDIREVLLGKGQEAFLSFRRTYLLRRPSSDKSNGRKSRRGSDVGVPGSATRPLPTAEDVDLSCLLGDEDEEEVNPYNPNQMVPPPAGPSPKRLLKRFATEAPDLLKLVIARCISDLPEERSIEAEMDCLRFADGLDPKLMEIGQRAVMTAIEVSGSAWVRPKLEEARRGLGL
ncbi:uncharacterized protein FA14DRAFT_181291 [Meira miltonrushii]|uniref:Protein kinase domain-containing protein n=1 Tax=Meira miltonrushii TaxID=1280837 RepID=A0A316V6G4_9BASI|nr:uncharacterized protein FA14DRAFT_181291 [Meira miltonrushii]PWN32608.1 hypothetical protein FA14DRAFT_181291 [Meira miltonrushii]